jgi:hypothetical protein
LKILDREAALRSTAQQSRQHEAAQQHRSSLNNYVEEWLGPPYGWGSLMVHVMWSWFQNMPHPLHFLLACGVLHPCAPLSNKICALAFVLATELVLLEDPCFI